MDRSKVVTIADHLPSTQTIYSSPLSRCSNLAQGLGSLLNLEVCIDDALKELNFGEWEMKSWDAIGAKALDDWIASGFEAIHAGESLADFDARISRWANSLDSKVDAAVVTHAGVIRSLFRTFTSSSLEESLSLPIEFGEVIRFEIPT